MNVVLASDMRQSPQAHGVQFYTDDRVLLDVLRRFIGGALAAGDGAVVIATQAHHDALAQELRNEGFDAEKAVRQGRYIREEAGEVLSRIMVNGLVDKTRFTEVVGDLLTRAANAAQCRDSRVVAFGELVALLWAQGKTEEALRVEQFWNDLSREQYFSLLCAYPVAWFNIDGQIEPFLRMCAEHSGVIASENFAGVGSIEERLRTIADLQQKTVALEAALRLRNSEERFRLFVEGGGARLRHLHARS